MPEGFRLEIVNFISRQVKKKRKAIIATHVHVNIVALINLFFWRCKLFSDMIERIGLNLVHILQKHSEIYCNWTHGLWNIITSAKITLKVFTSSMQRQTFVTSYLPLKTGLPNFLKFCWDRFRYQFLSNYGF